MDWKQSIIKLKETLHEIQELQSSLPNSNCENEFLTCVRNTKITVSYVFGSESEQFKEFIQTIESPGSIFRIASQARSFASIYEREFNCYITKSIPLIRSFIKEVENFGTNNCNSNDLYPANEHNHIKEEKPCERTIEKIKLICNKFHQSARKMRSRYNNRPTLEINDEYDVQDLFHCLLISHGFEDIRKEESNPSHAGSNSRSDFLLKPEQTVIEIKKTRQGLNDKKLGEELTLDISKYQAHPDCETLVYFVYDPEGRISNPRGIERDLEKVADKIEVKVFIRP